MKKLLLFLWLFIVLTGLTIVSQPAMAKDDCANLAKHKLDNVTITSAVFMNDPEGFTLPQTPGMFGTPPGLKTTAQFCRVTGFIEPVKGSHIRFEVWMPPADKWNERYFGVGNPAFEGAIKYQGLMKGVEEGYATASTDTGHQHPGHEWALGHPERLIDWTHRAVHETTVAAKSIVKAYYGKPQKYAYWDNCHNGGRQGLTEAQLYLSPIVLHNLGNQQTGACVEPEFLWDTHFNLGPFDIFIENFPRQFLTGCQKMTGVKKAVIYGPVKEFCGFNQGR